MAKMFFGFREAGVEFECAHWAVDKMLQLPIEAGRRKKRAQNGIEPNKANVTFTIDQMNSNFKIHKR